MSWLKQKAKEFKEKRLYTSAARKTIKKRAAAVGFQAEEKYAKLQAQRRAKARYAPGSQTGFKKFATGIGKSMEDIGGLSGTGPVMVGPSAYYQKAAKSVRRASKKGKKVKRRVLKLKKPKTPKSLNRRKPIKKSGKTTTKATGPPSYHSYARRY